MSSPLPHPVVAIPPTASAIVVVVVVVAVVIVVVVIVVVVVVIVVIVIIIVIVIIAYYPPLRVIYLIVVCMSSSLVVSSPLSPPAPLSWRAHPGSALQLAVGRCNARAAVSRVLAWCSTSALAERNMLWRPLPSA